MKSSYLTLIPQMSLITLLGVFTLSKVTAMASNELSVEFPDQPLFTIENLAPGETKEKSVSLQNNTSNPQQALVLLKKEGGSKDLENVLTLTMSEGANVYRRISMKEALVLSNGPTGIPLFTLDSQEKKQLTLHILFDPESGNAYQNASLTFSITFQTTTGIPAECQEIPNLSPAIEGTAKSERLEMQEMTSLMVKEEETA
jgi:hypothetical protein